MKTLPLVSQATLLIVDDEESLRYILTELFEADGVRCLTAPDGSQGLEIISKENSIDAIICDINMPQMDGLAFLEALRERGYNTPLIFLTGYGDRNSIIRALKNGAFDFIDKPFDLKKIHDSVSAALLVGMKLKKLEDDFQKQSRVTDLNTNDNRIKRQLLLMKSFSERRKKAL